MQCWDQLGCGLMAWREEVGWESVHTSLEVVCRWVPVLQDPGRGWARLVERTLG